MILIHLFLTSADSEFTKIGITRAKSDALRGAAEQCIGQLAFIVDQKTTVEVQSPQDLAGSEESRHRGGRHGPGAPPPGPPCRRPRPASPHL